MCGIAGFLNFSDGLDLAIKANEIQKHRGPDNQSTWQSDNIALAHQRLSIIDLNTRSNQPYEKHQFVIIYNGEIYNYKKLKKKYLQNVIFETDSDTEVVLEMFLKYGKNCLNYFIGMFAFSIYNKTKKDIFCARDYFGIKPFYYYNKGNKFAFASELKTLSKLIPFNKKINKKALIESLNYLWIPGDDTIFESFKKLPPAHFITINHEGKVLVKKYWNIETITEEKEEEEIISNLNQEFQSSIERHMVADVPVSSFLSGGLDSSMISVAAKRLNDKLSTYTIGTESIDKKVEQMPDDQKYAKMLADKKDFDHNEIIINSDITSILPEMVRILDEPIGDPAAINTYLICKAARERGVKVLLSGMGADEIFCGYRRQKALLIAQKYKTLPRVIRKPVKHIVNVLPVKIGSRGLKLIRWSKKFISFAEMPNEEAYRMSYSYYNKDELIKLLKDDSEHIIDDIYDDHKRIFEENYENDLINKMCYTDLKMFMVGLNLTYTDRSSMAASVEVRVPFIDKNLISFGMLIPGKFKYFNNESKYVLKKVAESLLPQEIIYRPKASFGAPIRSWISGDLKDLVDTCLSKENIEKRGIFNYKYIKKMIDDDRKGIVDNAYRIYQLITIELWFKEFVD